MSCDWTDSACNSNSCQNARLPAKHARMAAGKVTHTHTLVRLAGGRAGPLPLSPKRTCESVAKGYVRRSARREALWIVAPRQRLALQPHTCWQKGRAASNGSTLRLQASCGTKRRAQPTRKNREPYSAGIAGTTARQDNRRAGTRTSKQTGRLAGGKASRQAGRQQERRQAGKEAGRRVRRPAGRHTHTHTNM